MKCKWVFLFFAMVIFSPGIWADDSTEKLPELIEGIPPRPFELLSPVGAGKKNIPDAREQLRKEAKKVDAEAVIDVRCEAGGFDRQGLTWFKKEAYCSGKAVRFKAQPAVLF